MAEQKVSVFDEKVKVIVETVKIVVEVVDRATEPVRAMNAAVQGLTDKVREAAKAIRTPLAEAADNLGKVTGVTALAQKFQALGESVKSVHGHVGGLVAGLAGLAGAKVPGLAEGFLTVGKAVVATSAETEKYESILSNLLGSQEKAKEAMKGVSDFADRTPFGLAEAANGFIALQNNGIAPTDQTMGLLGDTAMALNKPLSEVVKAVVDGARGEVAGLKALGIASETKGDKVSLSFTDKDGVKRTMEAAKGDARELQDTILKIFQDKGFEGALSRWSQTWEGMRSSLDNQVSGFWQMIGDAGAFDFIKEKLKGLLDKIEELKGNGTLERWAKGISDAFINTFTIVENLLKRVDWEQAFIRTSDAIANLAAWIQQAVGFVGGWENALLAVVGVLSAPMLLAVVQLVGALAWLAGGFVQVGVSLGAMAFGPVIAAVGNFIVALRAGYGVMAAFNLVMAANPIGLVIVGVAALAGAAYAVYANWGVVVEGIKSKWQGFVAWLKEALHTLTGWLPDWAKKELGLRVSAEKPDTPPAANDGAAGNAAANSGAANSGAANQAPANAPPMGQQPGGAVELVARPPAGTVIAAALATGMGAAPLAAAPATSAQTGAVPIPEMALPWAENVRQFPPSAGAVQPHPPSPFTPRPPGTLVPGAMAPGLIGPGFVLPETGLPPLPAPALPVPMPRGAATAATVLETPAVRWVAGGIAPAVPDAARPKETAAKAQMEAPAGWMAGGMAMTDGAQTLPGPAFPPAGTVQGFAAAPQGMGQSIHAPAIHAPVTVSITVNGVAELDQFRAYAEDAVRRALDDWSAQQQSDADASLWDVVR